MTKCLPLSHYRTASVIALMLCLASHAASADNLSPRAEVNVRAGTERSILMTEFWAPLAQQNDRVLYGDLRLMGDDGDNREGNLGFGYRQISPKTNSVLGASAWIDRRRTENGNKFHQITLGVESLGETIDIRANGYIQLNGSKTKVTPNIGSATPYLAGSGIFYDTNGFIVEEPQHGFDAEVGYRIPVLQKYIDSTRVYAGGYHFFGDTTDNVTGFRFRTEAQINSMFSVGARFQHDEPRGSQGFLEATLRFPFKAKKLYQEHGLRSRLDENPERDIDIVTGSKVDTGLMKPVVNTATGETQRILYVDNTNMNGGDGTKENPFNTLADAQAALQENDILYINRGDGTSMNMDKGIVIDKNNIRLIGSGSALIYNGFTLLSPTLAPILTNTINPVDANDLYTGNGILVTGDNAFISGITVTGARYAGIYILASANTLNSVTIDNSSFASNNAMGIRILARENSRINNVTITNNTSSGNISGTNAANGIVVGTIDNSQVGNVTIDNNTVISNANSGIAISSNTGKIENAIIRNNTVIDNNTGIAITATTGIIDNILIENNITNLNLGSGIRLYIPTLAVGVIKSAIIQNNISSQNTSYGFYTQGQGGSIDYFSVNNNIFSNNANGIYLVAQQAHSSSGVITNNVVTNNTQQGVYLRTTQTGSFAVSLSQNTITGNGSASAGATNYYGIYMDHDSTGTFNIDSGGGSLNSIGQNHIFNNSYRELYLESMPGTGATTGTTISAQNNWWGVDTGLATSRRTLDGTSAIDGSGFLTTDPQP
jgi:hypothetical protein